MTPLPLSVMLLIVDKPTPGMLKEPMSSGLLEGFDGSYYACFVKQRKANGFDIRIKVMIVQMSRNRRAYSRTA